MSRKFDLEFIATSIGNLSGLPIRIFYKNKLSYSYSLISLTKDPFILDKDEILKINNHVGYVITDYFAYFGVINYLSYKIIIGPTRNTQFQDQEIRDLALKLELNKEETNDFFQLFRMIQPMPLESLIQILIIVNYVLNKEKINLEDIVLFDEPTSIQNTSDYQQEDGEIVHNTLSFEEKMLNFIRNGDPEGLEDWFREISPTIKGGVLAKEQLRHLKNTFIVTATIVSRAAIRGGLSSNEALTLSDKYIQKCELSKDSSEIINLQYKMNIDFANKVKKIRNINSSPLVIAVNNYIYSNLSSPITTNDISKELFLSRTHLSMKFKKETGENLSNYILKKKLEEAENLLKDTSYSISSISIYLGFSSPSHFNSTFKKFYKITPLEYRNRNLS